MIDPTGTQIATSCIKGSVNIWKINSEEPPISLEPAQPGAFSYCVAYVSYLYNIFYNLMIFLSIFLY